MPHASFKVQHQAKEDFSANGIDEIKFSFSANKNIEVQDISKIASGGEISRLMLTIKALISQSSGLPSIIFDEIDAGVSGDIADRMGDILLGMSATMQLICITHLPQIASKGQHHFVVYKYGDKSTFTGIKILNDEERVTEIAKMLSGKELTDAAIINAKELLKN
jgi:DNA repair protein RecN (Recombination protein N)